MPVFSEVTTVATATATRWIPLDQFETPFNVGFGVVKSGGGNRTFSVQHTFDNIFDPNVTPSAFTHADVTAATASIDGNYAFPVAAVRLNVASGSGSAQCRFVVRQTGSPN